MLLTDTAYLGVHGLSPILVNWSCENIKGISHLPTRLVANKASRQMTNALDIVTAPIDKDWRQAMKTKIRGICQEHGLSYLTFYHDLYEELDNLARVDLNARKARLRTRLKGQGATKTACKAITKLEVIERDPKLIPIFDGIVRKYQAKYAAV